MKLYYAVGSSSLTPHIVLFEAGLQFESIKVDEHSKAIEGGGNTSPTRCPPRSLLHLTAQSSVSN